MVTSVHYLQRQASRERRAAREALTDAARERHAALAAHYASLAEGAQSGLAAASVGMPDLRSVGQR